MKKPLREAIREQTLFSCSSEENIEVMVKDECFAFRLERRETAAAVPSSSRTAIRSSRRSGRWVKKTLKVISAG